RIVHAVEHHQLDEATDPGLPGEAVERLEDGVVHAEVPPEEVTERRSSVLPRAAHADLRKGGEGILRPEGQGIGGQPGAEALDLVGSHSTEVLDDLGTNASPLTDAPGELRVTVAVDPGDLQIESRRHEGRRAEENIVLAYNTDIGYPTINNCFSRRARSFVEQGSGSFGGVMYLNATVNLSGTSV